ncbi:MAG TPA: class I SAM-dependent DNA methyltransferase, partial [Myxococcota bacterium]|nr:class I SAM-dependent DNA methyltransferase [Myxococcota bacterium]
MASSDFLTRWQNTTSAERAVYQQFFTEFCAFLGVDAPDPQARERYCFEKSVRIPHDDGTVTTRRADFYKEAHFVIEAKQGGVTGQSGTAVRGTPTWERAMRAAYAQAINYAHYFPEGRPPFVITVDIGHVFEVWTGFSGHYGDYGARRTIPFSDLAKPEMVAWFRAIFTDPHSLDPALLAARVTREVAADLAELAKSLELAGHPPEAVSAFLMRCIFTMFAEDIHLLEDDLFTHALRDRWVQHPERFVQELGQLWEAMDKGLPFGFSAKLLRFNGGLFSSREVLPLNRPQLGLLLAAAKREWSHVEPSIFGTLVERALSPQQRDSFGAHFTPRAYIERIVRPAVIEPIRQH